MTLFTYRTAQGRCPCGAEHAACGPPSTSVPVDQNIKEVAAVGGPLRKYRYVTPSGARAEARFNAADAEAHGLTDADLSDAPPAEPEEKAVAKTPNKARTTSPNKARAPRGKGGAGGGD